MAINKDHGKADPLRKSSTLSTTAKDTHPQVIFPSPETARLPAEDDAAPSPIKWGFLAAALVHFANIWISGLTSGGPWAGIHGTTNIVICALLVYVYVLWDSRFNANLYVRRTLLRLSWSVDILMLGTLVGHLTVIGAEHRASGVTNEGYAVSGLGIVRHAAVWQPGVSFVLVVLWTAFAYVQFVAVENIRTVQLPVNRSLQANRVTTIAEEVASTEERAVETDVPRSAVQRFLEDSLLYYGVMLGAALSCWTLGFPITPGAPHIAVAGGVGALVILTLVTSLRMRSRGAGIIFMGGSTLLALVAVLLNILRGSFTAPSVTRWTFSVLILLSQAIALAVSVAWYRDQADVVKVEVAKAPVTLFRRRDPSNEDPMDYFMAGMANKEDMV